MGNVYSAQHVAAYFIYELNDLNTFINPIALQHLLAEVENTWQKVYGYSAFAEKTSSLKDAGYVVKEVYDAYKEIGEEHILVPAKEWYLEYGKFQLVYRTYGVPSYTVEEVKIINNIIDKYRRVLIEKVS